jgi:hypothetical protein
MVGRDSSVGIATSYTLDSQGIESQWGRDFQYQSRRALGPTKPPVQWYWVIPGGKVAGAPSSAEVKERVYLIPLLPLWAFVACSRVSFTFTYRSKCYNYHA